MDNLQKRLRMNFSTLILSLIILCPTTYTQRLQTKLQNDAAIFNYCWLYSTDEAGIVKFASDNDLALYLSYSDGKILSLNLETVEKLWETNLAGNIASNILVDKDNIYITAKKPDETENEIKESLTLYSLDKLTGITQWQIKVTSKIIITDKLYLYDTGNSLTIILASGVAYSLAKTDGKLLWERSLESNLSARPLKKSAEIILGTVDKQIIFLSLKDGNIFHKIKLDEQPAIIAEDTKGNNLIIGDRKGMVWSLNRKKHKRNWTLRQGAATSDLQITPQGLLLSSFDNFVYLISETSGKLIWKKRLPGRIAAEPQIKDNNIIISSIDESAAFVIELSSGKLVNKILLEGDNFFTGESIQLKNLFVYSTRRGVFSFSMGDDSCRVQKNRL